MNYSIIKDPEKLRKFIEWLPELLPGEGFYVSLLARSKYCLNINHINTDKQQLSRFLATKSTLFERLEQLEVKEGCYYQKHNPIPQEALAVYITINPRSYEKAAKNCLIKLAQLITEPYSNYNPVAEALSEAHKAVSRKLYLDIDFDNPYSDLGSEETYWSSEYFIDIQRGKIEQYINKDCLTYLQTRGGFHLLIELKKIAPEFESSWYRSIITLEGADYDTSHNMIPIPGCVQGNFTPTFIL